jgi:hypothetical protein
MPLAGVCSLEFLETTYRCRDFVKNRADAGLVQAELAAPGDGLCGPVNIGLLARTPLFTQFIRHRDRNP